MSEKPPPALEQFPDPSRPHPSPSRGPQVAPGPPGRSQGNTWRYTQKGHASLPGGLERGIVSCGGVGGRRPRRARHACAVAGPGTLNVAGCGLRCAGHRLHRVVRCPNDSAPPTLKGGAGLCPGFWDVEIPRCGSGGAGPHHGSFDAEISDHGGGCPHRAGRSRHTQRGPCRGSSALGIWSRTAESRLRTAGNFSSIPLGERGEPCLPPDCRRDGSYFRHIPS